MNHVRFEIIGRGRIADLNILGYINLPRCKMTAALSIKSIKLIQAAMKSKTSGEEGWGQVRLEGLTDGFQLHSQPSVTIFKCSISLIARPDDWLKKA